MKKSAFAALVFSAVSGIACAQNMVGVYQKASGTDSTGNPAVASISQITPSSTDRFLGEAVSSRRFSGTKGQYRAFLRKQILAGLSLQRLRFPCVLLPCCRCRQIDGWRDGTCQEGMLLRQLVPRRALTNAQACGDDALPAVLVSFGSRFGH